MNDARSVAQWIERRQPPVPSGFAPFVAPSAPDVPASAAAFVAETRAALGRMERSTELRKGAFHLLAADGFVTWACERALEEESPMDALRGVLDALTE